MSGPARRAVGSARALAVRAIRTTGREVAWTPPFMGFGNLLFLILWADQGTRAGSPRWILETPALTPWLDVFPALRERVLGPDEVSVRDRRVRPWREAEKSTEFGSAHVRGFSDEEMDAFVRRYLLDPVRALPPADPDRLVVNVRRGDYYSDPDNRAAFGYDQEAYLRVAVPLALQQGPVTGALIVSDDPGWCAEHLGWLGDLAGPVTNSGRTDRPETNFFDVARARRVVITNSTFSYWAAFVSQALHGDDGVLVVVPRFFDRTQNDGRSWLLDERWTVVEELPGGWATGGEVR